MVPDPRAPLADPAPLPPAGPAGPAALDLREIAAVDAVAGTRSFKAAADRLHTSQPTLSRLIASAEGRLGSPLFRRGWSGADTTARGDAVARTCRSIMAELARTEAQLAALHAPLPPLRSNLRSLHLAAIVAVVQEGSVSRAAQRMGRAQPELSRLLSDLSGRFGLALFRRTAFGVEPMPAAAILAALDGTIRFHLDRLAQDLARLKGAITGRVAIGMLPFSGQDLIFRAFAELGNDHPGIRLACIPGSYNALVEALRRREIDAIIGILRQGGCPEGLVEERLYDERFVVLARRDHPLHPGPADAARLAATRWIVAPHGTPVRQHFETVLAGLGVAPPTQTCELLSFGSVEQMLVHSASVAMLTYSDRRLADLRPDLAEVQTPFPPVSAPIGITRLRAFGADPAMDAFCDRLARIVACHS